jgi:hypothetical protein
VQSSQPAPALERRDEGVTDDAAITRRRYRITECWNRGTNPVMVAEGALDVDRAQ